ncbi:ribonuclease R [Aequitasia blattaphilus]|uniref:Ribonuclease R n=1 Tax=Aequitasia blattaphilus TaxID=2949332 RepID=A0ABT1ECZ5_9FIRM|nr:ribonuclease R [Aequitasia blattaphilus]MCP1103554.1 ribonuclease R [Aequitasia blattaphilus]MCR8616194.1 ribonuclease R [Aequitasia blattaphilus]
MSKEVFEKRKKVIYDLICDPYYVPMKSKEIAMLLSVPKEEREELRNILQELVEEGKIQVNKKGKYKKGNGGFIRGTYRATQRGFGFVVPEGEEGKDIYISENYTNGALDQDDVDVVLVETKSEKTRSREGKIVRIVKRGIERVVGLYQKDKKKQYGFVIPDDVRFHKDIYIPVQKSKDAKSGDKVVVGLTSYGDEHHKPEGVITEVLGGHKEPGVDVLSIVKDYDLAVDFPEKVNNQALNVSQPVSQADCAGREDLRKLLTITIDGEDAKDLDDAITLEKSGDEYILGVHIADVTNYVQENSALDKEALKRGTSVYLVDRVIPMLPRTLSNGICSLNANEDRLTLSCIMKISKAGEVLEHRIVEGVICVNNRMTYTNVWKILEGESEELNQEYKELIPMLEKMKELSAILREKRKKRGSIDFDFPETKVILDDQGKPIDIKPYERNTATDIIEDFMLLANETVAEDYFWQEIPFVYRTHDVPQEDKVRSLATFINNFGYSMHIGQQDIKPMEIQKLLTKIEGSKEEGLISRLALRSMKQARYTPENTGHFGLAARYYTHFTSPIRRYPDLQIHRIIKDNIRGRMTKERREHYEKILPEVTKQSSAMERKAEEAERESIKLKKVEYMKGKEGEVFSGVISGMTKWGMYVELPNTVEGLVHLTNLTDDYYHYDETRYEMIGERLGRVYKLGQRVEVSLVNADIKTRTIDFILKKGDETKDV